MTYDTLIAKKPMCESVTKQCVAVKDKVWDTFLREVAPELKSAELIAESNLRMNCIGNISECFQKACKDNIDPNDPEGSYDMCLSRPQTMRSLCKVQIDPCEAAEPQIMDYVYARLASMRVDACTKEVKSCLTDENRCGKDYANCVGLDLQAIRDMCPLEKLVGCQKNGQEATWTVIDNIVQGIYLNIDNSMLNQCQQAVNTKYLEICGDEGDCAAFDTDAYMGADSLIGYKESNGSFVIEGLLSFGNVKVKEVQSTANDVKFGKYELDIRDYSNNLQNVSDGTSVIKERVLSTLQSTQNKINQKIAIFTSDPKISMCISGRDMRQIRGDNNRQQSNRTEARYPNLLDSTIMSVINAGLEKAEQNYQKKLNELISKATEDANDEKKAAMCAAMATGDGTLSGVFRDRNNGSEIGLTGDGYGVRMIIDGMKLNELLQIQSNGKGEYVQTDNSGNMIGKIVMNAVYSPDTNICKLITTTTMCANIDAVYNTSNSCKSGGFTILGGRGCGGSGGILNIGVGSKTSSSTFAGTVCTKMQEPVTKTEEIKM